MPKLLFFIVLCLFISPQIKGTNEAPEVKFLNPSKKEVNPGDNINCILDINNQADDSKTIALEFALESQNLRFIGDYSSLKTEKKTSQKKIISIKIPGNFPAGDFAIAISVKDKATQQVINKIEYPIFVKPKFEFTLTKLNAPSYVFSGDGISIKYQIQNASNVAVKIKTTLAGGMENQISELDLAKDSSLIIEKTIKTTKKVEGYFTQSIIFIAEIADNPETQTSIYTAVDVFPSEIIKFDKYERFPINVSSVLVASNRAGKLLYSGMYDILGSGTLGKNSEKTLDFHLRGPDRTGNPLFGLNDEYYLKYKSSGFSANIGDYSFGLSELTESSRSGRGIELKSTYKMFSLGAYYNLPRYYPLIKNVIAASTGFSINSSNNITIGFLTKTDTLNKRNSLYSISGIISPFSWLRSEGEYAFSHTEAGITKAYKTNIQFNISKFNTNIVYLYADPNFTGFVKNSYRLNIGSSFQLKKLNLSANYDMNKTNMALDTLFGNMPYSKSININAGYRISSQNMVSISYNDISLEDRSNHPLFDYTRKSGRFMLQSRYKSFNVSFIGDVGEMTNRLDTTGLGNSFAYSGTMAIFCELFKNANANIFGSYQGGEKNVSGNNQFYYGGGFSTNLSNNFSASIQYTSNFEWALYTSDRSLLSLNLTARLNSKNELNLTGNYNLIRNTLDQKEYNVQLRYIYKLNLPYSIKKNLGSVAGRIINNGIPRVDNIRLNLNGVVSMSDKEGYFKFTTVPVGTHILVIDASTLGLNVTKESPGPIQIKVEPGKVAQYNIPMTTTGRISGRIVIDEDQRSNQKGFIPVKENIEKLIVELSNGTQLFRVYTNKDGGFGFDDLLPGKWQLKVYPNGLPQGYSLIKSIFDIDLLSGKSEVVEVHIQKKARQIQFQKK